MTSSASCFDTSQYAEDNSRSIDWDGTNQAGVYLLFEYVVAYLLSKLANIWVSCSYFISKRRVKLFHMLNWPHCLSLYH